FLEQSTYGQAAITIAHELSHIVLESIQHPLKKEEKAVDLTAMLLGFSRLYKQNAHTDVVTDVTHSIMSTTTTTEHRELLYLSESELRAASKILNSAGWRFGQSCLAFIEATVLFWSIIIAIGLYNLVRFLAG